MLWKIYIFKGTNYYERFVWNILVFLISESSYCYIWGVLCSIKLMCYFWFTIIQFYFYCQYFYCQLHYKNTFLCRYTHTKLLPLQNQLFYIFQNLSDFQTIDLDTWFPINNHMSLLSIDFHHLSSTPIKLQVFAKLENITHSHKHTQSTLWNY